MNILSNGVSCYFLFSGNLFNRELCGLFAASGNCLKVFRGGKTLSGLLVASVTDFVLSFVLMRRYSNVSLS